MTAWQWLQTHPLSRPVVRFGRLAGQAWKRFAQDYCHLLAAALSFYALVSLIPLCFLMLWTLSHWFGPKEAYRMVTQIVHQHIPQSIKGPLPTPP